MNDIRKLGAETKYNSFNQQINLKISTPLFKGSTDTLVKPKALENKLTTVMVAALGFIATEKGSNPEESKDLQREARLKARADARKKAAEEEKVAQKAAKNERLIAKLKELGITDIKINNNIISFAYCGTIYELEIASGDKVNLIKTLAKTIRDDILPQNCVIKAKAGDKSYECDWLIGRKFGATEKMYEYLENNQEEMQNPYFNSILEDAYKYMNKEELDEAINQHKAAVLSTKTGARYLETLKIVNPKRYIEILTPEKLFETAAGKRYLKINAPKTYEELRIKS